MTTSITERMRQIQTSLRPYQHVSTGSLRRKLELGALKSEEWERVRRELALRDQSLI